MDAREYGKQGGKFLRKQELRDSGPRRLVIVHVESVENKFTPGEQVLQLVCDDGTRLDLRTQENQNRLIGWFGHDTDNWIDQVVEAYYSPDVRSPKGDVGGVRLRLPAPAPDVSTFVSELETGPRRAKPNGSSSDDEPVL